MSDLLNTLAEISGGWGDRVTDYAHDYADPGYQLEHGHHGVVFGNWNPRRFPRGDDAPLTKEENIGPRLAAAFEWLGYDLQWSDEWTRCGECYRAMRTQPDSYGWTMFGAWVDDACEYFCADCLRADMATSLEPYHDAPHNAVTWATSADMMAAGWTQYAPEDPHAYENGWHPGQTDDPAEILAEIKRSQEEDRPVVFLIDGVGQFDMRFSAWVRDETDDDTEGEDQ